MIEFLLVISVKNMLYKESDEKLNETKILKI